MIAASLHGLSVDCVSQRVADELGQLGAKNRILADVLDDAIVIASRLGWRLTLTCIYRTPDEDRELEGSGIHSAWRAVDIRTKDVKPKLVADLKMQLDARWIYDPTRLDPTTGQSTYPLAYAKPHGTGPHLHLQVHPRTGRRV